MKARIMALDYGMKRTGIAVSDPMQMIASGLETVETRKLIPFLKQYFLKEVVQELVIGEPNNREVSENELNIQTFIQELKGNFPDLPIRRMDERFTSKMALYEIKNSGLKKKDRREKSLVDKISATLILRDYLQYRSPSSL
jgi:putative Holliday junction resolvase